MSRPERAFGKNEIALHEPARLGEDDPRHLDPVHQRDHHGDDPEARAEKGREHDRQQQRRKGHHEIGEAHDRIADETAEIARHHADDHPDEDRDAVRDEADDQRGPGAEQQSGEKVAPERIRAEPVFRPGRQRRAFHGQAVERLGVRRERRDPGSQNRGRHHDCDHDKGDESGRPARDLRGEPLHFGLPLGVAGRAAAFRRNRRNRQAHRNSAANPLRSDEARPPASFQPS